MIKAMSKVQIIGSKGLLDDVLKVIHSIGVIHIESIPLQIGIEDTYLSRMPVEKEKSIQKERLERILEKLKVIHLLLPSSESKVREGFMLADITSDELIVEMDILEKEVKGLLAEKSELQEEISSIAKYERILKGIAPLVTKLRTIKNFETIGITIDRVNVEIIPLLEDEISRVTDKKYQLFAKDIDKDTIGIVITYPKQYDADLKKLISLEAISEIKLPQKYTEMTLFDALKVMVKRREEIPHALADIDNKLNELSERWYKRLEDLISVIKDRIDELKAVSYCGRTRFAFVIIGWIPKDEFKALADAVAERFRDNVMVREMEIKEDEVEAVPVYIKNPPLLRPFEIFLNVLPLPKYGSIDPTPYIAIFLPTFFGLILGDAGYGTVLFVLSFYMRRHFKEKYYIKNLAYVFTISSVFAIFFGILFGEFFGDLGERTGILHPVIFDRLKALKVFLFLTIGIGLGHVVLGLIIAIVNYIHRGRGREAAAKLSMLTAILILTVLAGVVMEYLPVELITPSVIAISIVLIILMFLEGIIGPLDVLKTIGNILSYVRIMAVGTASVILAIVANQIGGLSGNLAAGILIAGIIHIINLFLAVIGSTLHSLRLHYVEFFSKFYQGGGRRYEPFKKTGK